MTRHLSLADVLALHAAMMRGMGWAPAPLRAGGEALLDSAIMRPRMAEHYDHADLIRQAAVLAVGISQAQAFLDGNKRTAYHCLLVFLRVNDLVLPLDDGGVELASQLQAVSERSDSLEAATRRLETWLRARVTPRT